MTVESRKAVYEQERCSALAIGIFQDQKTLTLSGNDALNRFCDDILKTGDVKGESGEITVLHTHGKLAAMRVVFVGLGEKESCDRRRVRQGIGAAANTLKRMGVPEIAVANDTFCLDSETAGETAQVLIEGIMLALYDYTRFKEKKENETHLEKALVLYESAEQQNEIEEGLKWGKIATGAANFSRDLQNHPGNWLTPAKLAELAASMAKEVGLRCEILERKDMEKLEMGALLGVAQGTQQPPKFIILEHEGKKSEDTIVFVGKAITFDSGGISIKPSSNMEEMKFDMSGGAAVLGAMKAVAELELPVHVVGLVPATENMPSGTSIRPGDILTASSGTTIDVINTDAEGRLILADALAYSRKYQPTAIIDLATLTGSVVVALGHHATGLLGNDQNLIDGLLNAGQKTGERLWQLPLWDDYKDDVKGDYADIKNSAGRAGGTITAAAFLSKFADHSPWAHLDIAGTAWTTKDQPHLQKGGTGIGVRLLVEYLRSKI